METSEPGPSGDGHSRKGQLVLAALALAAVTGLAFGIGPHSTPWGSSATSTHIDTLAGRVDVQVVPGAASPTPKVPANPNYMVSSDDLDRSVVPPPYLDGGKRIAVVRFGTDQLSANATFAPSGSDIWVRGFGGCEGGAVAKRSQHVTLAVNRVTVYDTRCTGSQAAMRMTPLTVYDPTADYSTAGVSAGRPSTLSVRVTVAAGRAVPGGFAVYQRITPSQYVLPPAPATLNVPPPGRNHVVVDSRTAGANSMTSFTVPLGTTVSVHRAAPGELTLTCNGKQLEDEWRYDWLPSSSFFPLSAGDEGAAACPPPDTAGQPLTVTIQSQYFSKPGWFVELQQHPDPEPTLVFQCGPVSASCQPEGFSYASQAAKATATPRG